MSSLISFFRDLRFSGRSFMPLVRFMSSYFQQRKELNINVILSLISFSESSFLVFVYTYKSYCFLILIVYPATILFLLELKVF